MNWYFMCFLVLVLSHCIDVGGRLLGVLEAVCKLSVLTISKIPPKLGILGGMAVFMLPLDQIQTELLTQL